MYEAVSKKVDGLKRQEHNFICTKYQNTIIITIMLYKYIKYSKFGGAGIFGGAEISGSKIFNIFAFKLKMITFTQNFCSTNFTTNTSFNLQHIIFFTASYYD